MQFENYIWVRLRERNLVRFGMPDLTYGYGYDSELHNDGYKEIRHHSCFTVW